MSVDKDGVATGILWNGPAFKADIINGTKIVAVDGLAYSRERIEAAVQTAADGKTLVRLLVERGGRHRNIAIDYHGGLRWPHLEKSGSGPHWFHRLLAPRRPLFATFQTARTLPPRETRRPPPAPPVT